MLDYFFGRLLSPPSFIGSVNIIDKWQQMLPTFWITWKWRNYCDWISALDFIEDCARKETEFSNSAM